MLHIFCIVKTLPGRKVQCHVRLEIPEDVQKKQHQKTVRGFDAQCLYDQKSTLVFYLLHLRSLPRCGQTVSRSGFELSGGAGHWQELCHERRMGCVPAAAVVWSCNHSREIEAGRG